MDKTKQRANKQTIEDVKASYYQHRWETVIKSKPPAQPKTKAAESKYINNRSTSKIKEKENCCLPWFRNDKQGVSWNLWRPRRTGRRRKWRSPKWQDELLIAGWCTVEDARRQARVFFSYFSLFILTSFSHMPSTWCFNFILLEP